MTIRDTRVLRYHDANCEVIVDERYLPLLITTWIGTATKEAVDWYFIQNDRALARFMRDGQIHAILTDACRASRPDASARSQIAIRTTEVKARYPGADTLLAFSVVVLTNSLVRGALTAVGWLVGGMDHQYSGSMEDALERARLAFEARNTPWPEGLIPSEYRVVSEDSGTGS